MYNLTPRSLTDDQKAEARKANYNFDHPSAFDFDKVRGALEAIRQGSKTTSVPAYDYVTHSVLPSDQNSIIEVCALLIAKR